MNQTLSNYEIVSVAERERVLITLDREELQGEWPVNIQGARLENGHLVLACEGAEGQSYNLTLMDFPETEAHKMTHYRASLCGIDNGRVDYAKAFPSLRAEPAPTRRAP